MTTFDAKPENLEDILERLLPEDELNLVAGEYKGQFVINQPITLRGVGKETCIFNIDAPPLIINCAGVKIENLSLARSDGGELIIGENPPGSPNYIMLNYQENAKIIMLFLQNFQKL